MRSSSPTPYSSPSTPPVPGAAVASIHGRGAGPGAVRTRAVAVLAAFLLAASLLAGPARAEGTLDEHFKGRASIDKKGVVTLRYDFHGTEQMDDWEDGAPFRVFGEGLTEEIRWFDGHLEIPARKGVRHKAIWIGDVTMEAHLRFDAWRDLGAYFTPADGTHDYVIYTLVEHYFHHFDGGQTGGQHSIIQFGDQWREADSADEFVGFRYISRKPSNVEHKPGDVVLLRAGWVKGKFVMAGPDELELEGRPKGPKLGNLVAGFYSAAGRLRLDDVTITGKIDPEWLKVNGVRLEIGAAAGDLDPATQAELKAHAAGDRKATRALVARLKNPGLEADQRTALEEALAAGPRQVVSAALDLLYDGSIDARTSGIAIIKAHLGKDYGFNPKASESRREAALKKITDAIQKDPELSGA